MLQLWRWFISMLVWLSADPNAMQAEAPRATAAVAVAYAAMAPEPEPEKPAGKPAAHR